MKKLLSTVLLVCVVPVLSQATAITVPPDITQDDGGANTSVYGASLVDGDTFTMTGGTVSLTEANGGDAYMVAIGFNAGTVGNTVTVSGGTATISEANTGSSGILQALDGDTTASISAGTFTVSQTGNGSVLAFDLRRGADLTVSGGTYNLSDGGFAGVANHIFAVDLYAGGSSSLTLSGGNFTNSSLDGYAGGSSDIFLGTSGASVVINSDTYLTTTGLTIDESGYVSDATGTISGTFSDGNDFSFTFDNNAGGTLQITGTAIPEPATLGLFGMASAVVLFLRRWRR